MKNGISIALLSLGLIACGGDSNKDDNSSFGEFSSGIKGVEEQPSLTRVDVSEGDSLNLNTTNHGNIEHYRSVPLNFTLEQDTQVALVLSSEDEDLNLTVSGHDLNLDSSLDASNELIVFNALAGELYSIEVDSHSALYDPIAGNSDFQLKLVEANRASVGLTTNEYLVDLIFTGSSYCSENSEAEVESDFSGSNLFIINWKARYISDSDGSDRISFKSVAGNAFTYSKSYTHIDEDFSLTSESASTFETNFNTGVVKASGAGASINQATDYTRECRSTSQGSGRILL